MKTKLVLAVTLLCAGLCARDLTWSGSASATWDLAALNWTDAGGNAAAFANGDDVTIDTSLAAVADTYQFIVSGYPAANESYAAASVGIAFATATRSGGSAASPLDARYRTWDESDGIPFRSDKFQATMIIFR